MDQTSQCKRMLSTFDAAQNPLVRKKYKMSFHLTTSVATQTPETDTFPASSSHTRARPPIQTTSHQLLELESRNLRRAKSTASIVRRTQRTSSLTNATIWATFRLRFNTRVRQRRPNKQILLSDQPSNF